MTHDLEIQRQRLIESLRREGISDERVLAAMASIPRELFLDTSQYRMAYEDRAL